MFKILTYLFLYFLGAGIISFSADALELEFYAQTTLPNKMNFKGTKIGGLSGLYWSEEEQLLYSVSDDRGTVNEPRFYKFKIQYQEQILKIHPEDVVFIHPNGRKNERMKTVLDMEAIIKLPWGHFLISNEGDNNHKPRVWPELMDIKPDGSYVRNYEIPKLFLSEKLGKQKKGIRNNNGFEGLSISRGGKILAGLESPLVQDKRNSEKWSRFILYDISAAKELIPIKQFIYPIEVGKPSHGIAIENGVSEVLFIDETRVLVMERALIVDLNKLYYDVKIFEIDLKETQDISDIPALSETHVPLAPIAKKLVFNFYSIKGKIGKIENYEGMTWIPGSKSSDEKLLLFVSDDNFMKSHRNHFIILKVKN